MAFYFAYVASVTVGKTVASPTTGRSITFTRHKASHIGDIVLVQKCEQLRGSYITQGGDIYHRKWLNFLTDATMSCVMLTGIRPRIVRIVDGEWRDITESENSVMFLPHDCFTYAAIGCGVYKDRDIGPSYIVTPKLDNYTCGVCETQCSADNVYNITENDTSIYVCAKCIREHYVVCLVCGCTCRKDITHIVQHGYTCARCYTTLTTTCAHCRLRGLSTDFQLIDNRHYCQTCFPLLYYQCVECGDMCERVALADWADSNTCEACYRVTEQRPIKNYTYKPKPTFLSKSEQHKYEALLYLGIELEVESRRRDPQDVAMLIQEDCNKDVKLVYCKSDSSVHHGFEIVTHPMTFNWIRDNRKIVDNILRCDKYGCTSDNDSCGIHIHMSKDAFTSFHLFKFLRFVYSSHNAKFICKVSQRGNLDNMVRYCNLRLEHDRPYDLAKNKGCSRDGRHIAVNLSQPHTVEVRIFRGTLKPEHFYKNIEFCVALYRFTKFVTIQKDTHEEFVRFVAEHCKEYPFLYGFLK